jgi:hypothetical protein
MSDIVTPTITPGEPGFRQLRQVTVRSDDEISNVNDLLAEGWRLVSVGHLADATVYVLGRIEEKQRQRTGFRIAD